jgi:3-hydroxybutyryl-CoA dehydratase
MDLGWVGTDEKSVLAYLRAVGDELPVYRELCLAPPLYVVALALGQILQGTNLPSGAIHSLQEFDVLEAIPLESELGLKAWLERERVRGGLRFMTFGVSAVNSDGSAAMGIRTTLLFPESQDQPERTDPGEGARKSKTGPAETVTGELPSLSRQITQSQLEEYSGVSGDHNPLHLDPEFAAGTQFGRIIAHGMLTLAFVSEMLAASLGKNWLSAGTLRARFKGAAYPGDRVETWGLGSRKDGEHSGYTVGLKNSATGEDLITGTATVKKN